MKYFFAFILLMTFSACSERSLDPFAKENLTLPIHEKMKLALRDKYLSKLKLNQNEFKLLKSIYLKNNFKPFWSNDSMNNQRYYQLSYLLKNTLPFGVPLTVMNHVPTNHQNFLLREISLTRKLLHLYSRLNLGLIDFQEQKLKTALTSSVDSTAFWLNQLARTKSISKTIINAGPQTNEYQSFANAFYHIYFQQNFTKKSFNIAQSNADSLQQWQLIKESIKYHSNYIPTDSSEWTDALKIIQKRSGLEADGRLGKYTITALNESRFTKLMRAIITLDKLRQVNYFSGPYIEINIPEFLLRFKTKNTCKAFKIIVGKPETATPELNSTLERIILFPFWTIPQSIKTNEILPELQKNCGYLAKHNMKLFINEIEQNPCQLNWNNFKNIPYKIRQEYGPTNSLGIIKFDFPNPTHVYIHDTPTKYLFNKYVRSFSHGCMRCENPVALAKEIIHYEYNLKHIAIDSNLVDSLILLKEHKTINLKAGIPVHITYRSVYLKKNQLIFAIDLYLKEEKYIQLFK